MTEEQELALGLCAEESEPRSLGLDRMDALLDELEEIAATLREQLEDG